MLNYENKVFIIFSTKYIYACTHFLHSRLPNIYQCSEVLIKKLQYLVLSHFASFIKIYLSLVHKTQIYICLHLFAFSDILGIIL